MIASVLIVNYNSGSDLSNCLEALQNQTIPRNQFEVIVVDNASGDDSIGNAEKHFSDVRYFRLNRNAGFADGNNIAATHATSDVVVLLNPDTRPDPFWLEELLATLESRNATAAVSKLVFADDPTRINSAGLMLLRDGRGADLGFLDRDIGQYEVEREVFAGCGAALAVRRKAFLFDPSLFLYYEDLDLGWRIRRAGGSIWYSPRSLVRHAVGANEQSATHRYYVERNRLLTAVRHADLPLLIYSIVLLALKVPQVLSRWLSGRLPFRTAVAVPKAFLAVMGNLPEALTQRYVNRSWRIRRCASS